MSQASKKLQWCLNKAQRELEETGLHTEKQKEPVFRPVMNALSTPASPVSQSAGLRKRLRSSHGL